jgi:hypothetical protein
MPHVVVEQSGSLEVVFAAVKRLLALVAQRIRQIVPQSRYGKTNLQEFLAEAAA